MGEFWQVALIVAGVFLYGAGLWEVRNQARMRRSGVRADGVVVRYKAGARSVDDTQPAYYPVIGFRDEYGIRHEFTSKVSGSSRRLPPGSPVRIVYLPGRPETARPATIGYRVSALAFSFGVGTLFLVIAVLFGPDS